MQKMMKHVDVNTYEEDMCQYDMKQLIKGEEIFVKKPSRFMTNSPCVGKELSSKCQGQHRHIELTGGGRTNTYDIYPDRLCRAVLNGLVRQMRTDDRIGCSLERKSNSWGTRNGV